MKYCKYDLNCRTVRILLWRRWGRLQTLTSSNWDRVKRNKCVCNNTTYNILFLIPRCTADLWYHKGIFCYLYFLNPQCIIVLHPTIKSTGCDITFILFCSLYFYSSMHYWFSGSDIIISFFVLFITPKCNVTSQINFITLCIIENQLDIIAQVFILLFIYTSSVHYWFASLQMWCQKYI